MWNGGSKVVEWSRSRLIERRMVGLRGSRQEEREDFQALEWRCHYRVMRMVVSVFSSLRMKMILSETLIEIVVAVPTPMPSSAGLDSL